VVGRVAQAAVRALGRGAALPRDARAVFAQVVRAIGSHALRVGPAHPAHVVIRVAHLTGGALGGRPAGAGDAAAVDAQMPGAERGNARGVVRAGTAHECGRVA